MGQFLSIATAGLLLAGLGGCATGPHQDEPQAAAAQS